MATDSMKALLVENGKMSLGEYSRPVRGSHDILIEVKAAGLNRADLLQRQGKYPPPKGASPLLGLEVAGIVTETGEKVSRWQKGDRVCGLLSGGGYAEFACMHEEMAMAIPDKLSFEEAAAIPEVFLTAWQALVWLARIQPGEKLLVHAGASGVGTAAIQLARQLGAEVWVTASAPKHGVCLELGASQAIDYKKELFRDKVAELTKGKGVDVIMDFIAAPYLHDNLASLATDGRLVMLALLGGPKADSLSLVPVLQKRLSILGSTLRSRSQDYQRRLTADLSAFLLPRLQEGTVSPVVDKIFPWQQANEAHAYMEANKNKGKIVLKLG